MVGGKALAELESKKQLLIAQAEIQRRLMQLEFSNLKHPGSWIGHGRDWLEAARPAWPLAAQVALFFFLRRWRKLRRWIFGSGLIWKILRVGRA